MKWLWWLVTPLARPSACFSAALSSVRAACLAAGGDMSPSAGAPPAVTVLTPAEEREV